MGGSRNANFAANWIDGLVLAKRRHSFSRVRLNENKRKERWNVQWIPISWRPLKNDGKLLALIQVPGTVEVVQNSTLVADGPSLGRRNHCNAFQGLAGRAGYLSPGAIEIVDNQPI